MNPLHKSLPLVRKISDLFLFRMIATEEQQTSEEGTIGQTPDKLDMNSRKNIMKNMYSRSKRNQGTDLPYKTRKNSLIVYRSSTHMSL